MSTANDFTTYWGNALQGIYINWALNNDETKVVATMDIRMYGVGLDSELRDTDNSSGTLGWRNDGDSMYAYFLFMNPWDIDDYTADNTKAPYNVNLPYDGMLATLTYGTHNVAPHFDNTEATYDDIWCQNSLTDGKYATASCALDTADSTADWTATAPASGDHCDVTWTVATYARCVRATITVDRLFTSTDTTRDMKLTRRAYSVTAGWQIPATATDIPGLQDFSAVEVDFSKFDRAVETYDGALDGVVLASSVLVAAILNMTF